MVMTAMASALVEAKATKVDGNNRHLADGR